MGIGLGITCFSIASSGFTSDRFSDQLSVDWVPIPAGSCRIGSSSAVANPPRIVKFAAFWLGRCEVNVAQYCSFLTDSGFSFRKDHPQLRRVGVSWRPKWGQKSRPVGHVDVDDALAYCRWLSVRTGRKVRLPNPEEWEYAARAGRSNVRYPWGWGSPQSRAVFAVNASRRVGSFAANEFALHDMAGNVFEWCVLGDDSSQSDFCEVRGGSWADRDPKVLQVYYPVRLKRNYHDADVRFRVLIE